MRRILLPTAVVLLTAACGSTHSTPVPQPTVHASASPSGTGAATPRTAGLTEDSTCADYLHASDQIRAAFLTHEVEVHAPQTGNPSFVIQSGPDGKGAAYNGDQFATTGMAAFIELSLGRDCSRKETAKLGEMVAWAWSSSPTP